MSKQLILDHALIAASEEGYLNMTKARVAWAAWCSPALVAYHFGSVSAFRTEVMREAVRVNCAPVVAQGLAMRDPIAMAAPDDVKQAAKEFLCS